jgi:hypothetical protein
MSGDVRLARKRRMLYRGMECRRQNGAHEQLRLSEMSGFVDSGRICPLSGTRLPRPWNEVAEYDELTDGQLAAA